MMHANGSWKDVLIDAGIAAGGAFSGALGGIAVAGVFPEAIWGAAVAGAIAFFGSLAASRKRTTPPSGGS